NPDHYSGPGLFVGDVEVEGPIEEWPPPSRRKLLGGIDPSSGTLADAERILSELLPRAYRRAVGPEDSAPILELIRKALEAGKPFEAALRSGLKGVLCSPAFLFLDEQTDKKFSQYALAVRLSYF